MDSKSQAERGTPTAQGEDRRRSQRVILRIPVTLRHPATGAQTEISAHTVAVNVHGAMLTCGRAFEAETRVEIENKLTREKIPGRVTRNSRESHEGHLVPVEFDKAAPSFWQIVFPPLTE
jgi:hypothetical protein